MLKERIKIKMELKVVLKMENRHTNWFSETIIKTNCLFKLINIQGNLNKSNQIITIKSY